MGPKVAASDSFPSCHPLVWDTQIKENCHLGQKVTREQWPQEAASESPKTDLLSFNLLKPMFPTRTPIPLGTRPRSTIFHDRRPPPAGPKVGT